MSTIIRKTSTGYELDDNGIVTTNLKVIFDKRKGCGDIKLPENSIGKKWFSESRFTDGITEIDLANIPQRTNNPNVTKTVVPKLNWEDFVTEEDQEILEEIKARAEKKMARAKLEAELKTYQDQIAKLMAQLNEEAQG